MITLKHKQAHVSYIVRMLLAYNLYEVNDQDFKIGCILLFLIIFQYFSSRAKRLSLKRNT